MPLNAQQIGNCATALREAQLTRKTIAALTVTHPDLSECQAYDIQSTTLRIGGDTHVGFKLGYTSAAMRAQMRIDAPNYGVLTEQMQLTPGAAELNTADLIHPLVEPEIALRIGKRLEGGAHDRASIWQCVDAVMPAIEVVDTRYHDYRFTQADNIADNSSGARFVLGFPKWPADIDDARHCAVALQCNGQVLDRGVGANALDDPLLALRWLVDYLAQRGQSVAEGSTVLTGGLTRAYPTERGQKIVADFGLLGSVALQVT